MKISFVEIEAPERAFFEQEFSGDDLQFCTTLARVNPDVEVLSTFIESKIDSEVLQRHSILRLIATRSTTFDHIDLKACEERRVKVCAVGTYGDHTVAEHTFGLILALCRKLRQAMQANNSHTFSYESLRGVELNGKTFGVVGAGRIGRQTLRIAKAFGMKTIAHDIDPDPSVAAGIGFDYVSFDELLSTSHFISLNVPLTPKTLHLINRETLARCQRGVILINTARGHLIDTEALIEALNLGIVGGAGLDVLEDERVMRKNAAHILVNQIADHVRETFAPPEPLAQNPQRVKEVQQLMFNADLLAHPNVVFTPHIAFNSVEALRRINRATADNIKAFISGSPRNAILPGAAALA